MPPSPRDTVRLLTGLPAGELGDDQIDAYLDLHEDRLEPVQVRLAAADALAAFASSLLDVQSDDITLSGSRRSAFLLARSEKLRTQASELDDDGDGGFFFGVAGGVGCRPELTERGSW